MRSTEGMYLDRVDHLRGWAAMLVLVYHAMGDFTVGLTHKYPSNPLFIWISDGHTGVSMFLVLSGFILTIINRDVLDGAVLSYRGFVYNRFLRIFPLLLFVTAIAIATRMPAFKSIELLPLLTLQLYAADTPGISSEWAVGVEFQCYLIFPLMLLAVRNQGLRYLAGFVGLMVLVRLLLNFAGLEHNGSYYSILLGRIDQFAVGMGAALVYLKIGNSRVTMLPCVVAILAGLAGLTALLLAANAAGGGNAMLARGDLFPAVLHLGEALLWALVLLGYVLLPVRRIVGGAFWSRLGAISFSLYLLHPLVTSAARKTLYGPIFRWLDVNVYGDFLAPAVGTLILVVPASVLIAMLSYAVIEQPAFALRKPYIRRDGLRNAEAATTPAVSHIGQQVPTR